VLDGGGDCGETGWMWWWLRLCSSGRATSDGGNHDEYSATLPLIFLCHFLLIIQIILHLDPRQISLIFAAMMIILYLFFTQTLIKLLFINVFFKLLLVVFILSGPSVF